MGRGHQMKQPGPSSHTVDIRNRASPARLTKLYKHLTKAQCKRIESIGFWGLLKIACGTLPSDFCAWLTTECYNPETSELIFPGRGTISVNAEAVSSVFGLPKEGHDVKYELDVDAINFIEEKYDIDTGCAPTISTIMSRIEENRSADDDFLRSFLMIAVSTFLCPPTGLSISPRCYPSITDLSNVKNLNWAQFVVDQLKIAGSKMNRRNSFKGCLLCLAILYVDSLLVEPLIIPDGMPRIQAWSRKLVDQVIELDTNRDGSFGKLKIKATMHSAPQRCLFQIDDIRRFVSSNVPRNLSNQRKSQLNTAVTEFCAGFTELLGSLLSQVSQSEDPGPHQEPRLKRQRVYTGMESVGQRPPKTKHYENSEAGPSSRRQTRSMKLKGKVSDEKCLDEDHVEELLSEGDEEDDSSEDDSFDYDADFDSDADDGGHNSPAADGHLPPIYEENPNMPDNTPARGENNGNDPHAGNDAPDGKPTERAEDRNQHNAAQFAGPTHTVVAEDPAPPLQNLFPNSDAKEADADSQEHVLLKDRLSAIQGVKSCAKKNTVEAKASQGAPADHPVNKRLSSHRIWDKLRLPSGGSKAIKSDIVEQATNLGTGQQASIADQAANKPTGLHFTPPEINLMSFIDSDSQPSQPNIQGQAAAGSSESPFSISNIPEEVLDKMERDAISEVAKRDAKAKAIFEVEKGGPSETPPSLHKQMGSCNSSVTPAYQHPPRRGYKRAACRRSPYVDLQTKKKLTCSKEVDDVYARVCAKGRAARLSKEKDIFLINYWDFHVSLDEVWSSVKPGADMLNTVAEIGIYAIDRPLSKKRKAIKRVLPLRISGYILEGQLDRLEISRVFRAGMNHLDHRQMVMFPVLQKIGNAGHYFLIVLNLRNQKFEVLDSIRSLEDQSLLQPCNTLMEGIKVLWKKFYADSKHQIEDFKLSEICVPKQKNIHDCGFHMLMHAENWDGRAADYLNEDMNVIRKILLYKWLTYDENDTDWMGRLDYNQG